MDEVRRAHRDFYRAFESLSIERMDEAWAHDDSVTCVHPGWPLAAGWRAVRETWVTIFRNTESMRFEILDERIDVRGDLAWIVCIEKIRSGDGEGAVLATNVLRRDGGRWRIVHHHGSPILLPMAIPAQKVVN
jgi:ketosteroid isomerase-like protein